MVFLFNQVLNLPNLSKTPPNLSKIFSTFFPILFRMEFIPHILPTYLSYILLMFALQAPPSIFLFSFNARHDGLGGLSVGDLGDGFKGSGVQCGLSN